MKRENENMHWQDDPRLSAYVLGELDGSELARFETELRENSGLCAEVQAMQGVADMLQEELAVEALGLSDAQRGVIVARARTAEITSRSWARTWGERFAWIGVTAVATAAGSILYIGLRAPEGSGPATDTLARLDAPFSAVATRPTGEPAKPDDRPNSSPAPGLVAGNEEDSLVEETEADARNRTDADQLGTPVFDGAVPGPGSIPYYRGPGDSASGGPEEPRIGVLFQMSPPGNPAAGLQPETWSLSPHTPGTNPFFVGRGAKLSLQDAHQAGRFSSHAAGTQAERPQDPSRESYAHIQENGFVRVSDDPLSTFSIDVDTASYANVRRFLNEGRLPPADAVRIEELVNYFSYDYAAPEGPDPFAVHLEVASAPWEEEHLLLRVGLKGREINDLPKRPKNLTFLIDVSGSMQPADKLPLLKQALRLLVDNLDSQDRIAIVVYAGAAGLVLPPTACSEKAAILQSLERLNSGGSTAGAAGIELAYRTAQESFIEGGVNRVILASDGDFNVGISDEGSLVRLIEEKREHGVDLSVLGFGTGNLQDSKMEQLANKGNGNYAYIDTLKEAHKVLVRQLGGTLETIAKDVKIQIEFNPREVAGFRLIGYENRVLAHTDFNDDTKDAGEIGAGHTVTALYELIPHGAPMSRPPVDPLKYQEPERRPEGSAFTGELLTVKLRYKDPQGSTSKRIERTLSKGAGAFEKASEDFRFAASVAAFGMILRGSDHCGELGLEDVMGMAAAAAGSDAFGYRSELLGLLDKADRLTLH